MPQNNQGWKTPVYVLGAIVGLLLGFVAAHMYTQAVEENHGGVQPRIETGDAFRLGMAGITFLRQITDLGAKGTPRR